MPKTIRHGDRHLDIDLIDKCNLRCPTCFRGTGAQKNTSAAMPLDKFREIVRKAKSEGYPNICLINWTEAFLLENVADYVSAVKEIGDIDCWISSNLSLPPERYLPGIIAALRAGLDVLFVSLSGWTQETYQINHKAGRVDWIKQNLTGIAQAVEDGGIETGIIIRYLSWPYNEHEAEPWHHFATELGITFDAIPAHGDPLRPLPDARAYDQHVKNVMSYAKGWPPLTAAPEKVCGLIMDRAAIDAKGDAYLCCAYPNAPELKIGNYLDMSESEFLLRRHHHPFCSVCQIEPRDATEADKARFISAMVPA